jgi:hypothetical protein
LSRTYGLSLEEYDVMAAEQDNRCAICNTETKGRLCVDHCHATGKVRGLLCVNCNIAIGAFRDSTINVAEALNYLTERS